MSIKLYEYQLEAINRMANGCILCGGVGSGKSRTALAYYYIQQGGNLDPFYYMKKPVDLYIITTARKRDTLEWDSELSVFLMSTKNNDIYNNKIIVDSWNNIKKYKEVSNSFFIFDEQRVVGSGEWVKTFINITKNNKWILLSATPGDTWSDYIPVFIANGFYKNKTEFIKEHVIYSNFSKFPKIDRYIGTKKLEYFRNKILVDMFFERKIFSHHKDIYTSYDISLYKNTYKNRWDPYKNEPIINAASLCYILRKIVNSDDSRQIALLNIVEDNPRVIVFYNFDYELEILKQLTYINDGDALDIYEWNGHKHQPIPKKNKWVYLVQYNSGAEGWNCISTNVIVFFSQNYSYKIMEQSSGRINRLNSPYKDLYYYHFKSRSGIDSAISKSLTDKKTFNERSYIKW